MEGTSNETPKGSGKKEKHVAKNVRYEERKVITSNLTDPSLFPTLSKDVRFAQREHLFQVKKVLLEMEANGLGREYFFYNLVEIVRDEFPIQFTTEVRMVLNKVLMEGRRSPVDSDEEFIKELYG